MLWWNVEYLISGNVNIMYLMLIHSWLPYDSDSDVCKTFQLETELRVNIRVLSRCLFFYYFYAIHVNNKGCTLASYRCTILCLHQIWITLSGHNWSSSLQKNGSSWPVRSFWNHLQHKHPSSQEPDSKFCKSRIFFTLFHFGSGIELTIMSHLYNLVLSLKLQIDIKFHIGASLTLMGSIAMQIPIMQLWHRSFFCQNCLIWSSCAGYPKFFTQ